MRRFLRILVIAACILSLCMPVFAANSVESLHNSVSLSPDGSCQVSINMTLFLESRESSIYFPLPEGAVNVTVNGSAAHVSTQDGVSVISLDKTLSGMFGSVSVSIYYRINNVLSFNEHDELTAVIPLLSGFSLPVEYLDFSITFPEEIPEYSRLHTDFYDTYLLDSVETVLSYSVESHTITGVTLETLKDHDSLKVTLPVSQEHFSDALILKNSSPWTQVAMAICVALAVVYWILLLRFFPPRAQRQTATPGNITAGEVGTLISNQGISLPLMAITWAQLGYVMLEIDRRGQVVLRKKMDMGNERSRHEMRIFAALFHRKDVVNTASAQFAAMSQRVYSSRDAKRGYFVRSLGRTNVYCLLFALAGMFAGIGVGSAWFLTGFKMVFFSVLFGVFGLVSAYLIQNAVAVLWLDRTDKKIYGAIAIVLWVLLAFQSRQYSLCLVTVALELLSGFTGPYAGKRTAAGKQRLRELYGLRRQIRRMKPGSVFGGDNPDYFYQLLPYALAFGLEDRLAKAFNEQNLPDCTFLRGGTSPRQGAVQFAAYLKAMVSAMDERRRNLLYERIFGK